MELEKLIEKHENRWNDSLKPLLDFHACFEAIHPFEDGNGRVGRLLLLKECLRHGVEPFIIDDKHRGDYNKGIAEWNENPSLLISVAETAQRRFRDERVACDAGEFLRPTKGRGAR